MTFIPSPSLAPRHISIVSLLYMPTRQHRISECSLCSSGGSALVSKGIIEPNAHGYMVKTDLHEIVGQVATFDEGLVLLQVSDPVITLPMEYESLRSWHKLQTMGYYFTPDLTMLDCIKDCQGGSLSLAG
jgi:hypothetical protein